MDAAADGTSTFRIAARAFTRLLGATYFLAFVSFGLQIPGLIGSEGILPIEGLVRQAGGEASFEKYRMLPTLCWLNPSDAFLRAQWVTGAALSLGMIGGLARGPLLAALWVLYLSLVAAGRTFMAFQWDGLLLETGFLATFLGRAPSPLFLGLLRWLLFRVLFSSGLVKFVTSGDRTWAELTALTYHYWTQPLPTWVGWYAHQLPDWFQIFSCIGVIVEQIFMPFAIFGPRIVRLCGAAGILFLQLLIALTGNYGYFNLLTVALCLLCLDDALLGRMFKQPASAPALRRWVWRIPSYAAGSLALIASSIQMASTARLLEEPSSAAVALTQALRPFRTFNGYGLFANMTTSRAEIVVEGSLDGAEWKPYVFPHKPQDPARAPGFVAPHMPRLDWQMWFAALGNVRQNPWFRAFVARLLEGSEPVLDLLEHNPFPDSPPKYVRAVLYQYRFTDLDEKSRTGHWWRAEPAGLYLDVTAR